MVRLILFVTLLVSPLTTVHAQGETPEEVLTWPD